MTSQSIKTTKTESKTPRNRSHQNQNLRTTHHSKSPTSSEILTISFWGEAKRNRNWIRSIKLPVVAVSEWVRSESRIIMGNITEENDEDVASISKHVAYLHCWQWDWVKTSKKKKNRRSGSVVVDLPATLSRCYEIHRNFWSYGFHSRKKREIGSRWIHLEEWLLWRDHNIGWKWKTMKIRGIDWDKLAYYFDNYFLKWKLTLFMSFYDIGKSKMKSPHNVLIRPNCLYFQSIWCCMLDKI